MRINAGLLEGQVLQRTSRNVSEAAFSGTCNASGPVWATVRRAGRALPGWGAVLAGRAGRGRVRGLLKGLPAGGPYEIHLSVGAPAGRREAALVLKAVWVGDVWLAGGQSNMQGAAHRRGALPGIEPVRAFRMDDRWTTAQDPIHNVWNAVDAVHGGKPDAPDAGKGVGPAVAFGQAMHAFTGVPQGVIACGHAGTTMTQWDPGHRKLGGYSLYGAMLRRFRKNGRQVAGMIWYQGESESREGEVDVYEERMCRFVRAVRRDCRLPRLPFVMVQLGRYAGESFTQWPWKQVQEIQRKLPGRIDHLAVVPAIDLPLEDVIHISGAGQQILGRRMADAMFGLIRNEASRTPIALKRVWAEVFAGEQAATIVVEFNHVIGKLESGSRPMGFDLVGRGARVPAIVDVQLDRSRVLLKTFRPILDFVDKSLHYGLDLDPPCTITDTAGRSLPVFGPVAVAESHLAMPSPRSVQVSCVRQNAVLLVKPRQQL